MSASQIILCIVAAVLLFWAVGAYNRLVGLRNVIGQAFVQLDPHLKRRHELIPQLARAIRQHLPEDTGLLDAAGAACQQAQSALDLARAYPCAHGAVSSLSMAEHVLDANRGRLLDLLDTRAALTGQPDLREAAAELNATENRLAYARQVFNDAVTDYNAAVRQFPTRLLSSLYGFREAAPLQAAPVASDPSRNT